MYEAYQNVISSSWGDFWAAITAISTLLVFMVGGWQIRAARIQAKGWKTMEICERYESDPVLHECLMTIFKARKAGEMDKDPSKYRVEITTILNYLDGIAIGIDQKLYLSDLARDHLEGIANHYVALYLTDSFAKSVGIDLADYARLRSLSTQWSHKPSHFKEGPKWWPF